MTYFRYKVRFKSGYETSVIVYESKVDKAIKKQKDWLRGYTGFLEADINQFEINLNQVEFIEKEEELSERDLQKLKQEMEK